MTKKEFQILWWAEIAGEKVAETRFEENTGMYVIKNFVTGYTFETFSPGSLQEMWRATKISLQRMTGKEIEEKQ